MKTLALLLALLLGGCATQAPPAYTSTLLSDSLFQPPAEEISTAHIFQASPAMKEYLRSDDFRRVSSKRGGAPGLIDALYTRGQLQLEYENTSTRTAAETFDSKSGNCLSLVIMTAAFAKELGLKVTFQDVRAEETWSRQGALYLASTHVNVLLGRPSDAGRRTYDNNADLLVDFLPPEDAATLKAHPIDEKVVIAMYANNRAAEMLAKGRVVDAYWWVREAIAADPAFDMAYNTLGVIYVRHGDSAMAERAFREVLARSPDNRIVLQNLLPVLETLGKKAEADQARSRLAALDPTPPFHYFHLGQAAMERKQYRAARELFAREVARAPYYHEFHFWHALASLKLGDTDVARRDLARAREASTTADNRARYSAKLDHMRTLVAKSGRR